MTSLAGSSASSTAPESSTSPAAATVTQAPVSAPFTFNFSSWSAPSQTESAAAATTSTTDAAPSVSFSFASTFTPTSAAVIPTTASSSSSSDSSSAPATAVDTSNGWTVEEYEKAQKIMQNTLSTREDHQQMYEWFMRGAAAGHAPSMYEAGARLCSQDEGDGELIAEGMKFIEEASQKGYAHALRYLGMCVASGENGQKKDMKRGEALLEQALELGDGFAGHNLACHLQRRLEQAHRAPAPAKMRKELLARIQTAYRRGAELGDPTCQHNLACALADGGGWVGKQDDEEALKWELLAARTNACVGSRAANYNLGQWHSLGLYGVKPDVNRAVEYWEKAGTAEAYHNLACLFDPRFSDQLNMRISAPELHPVLPAVDAAKTKRYLEQGAKLRNPRSEVMLGFAYQKGEIGCECSPDWALYLYYRAKKRGNARAVERLNLYLQALVMVARGEIDMKDALFSTKGKLEFCRMLLPVTDGGPKYFQTDYPAAARLLNQLVNEDDSPDAMVELARLLSKPREGGDADELKDVERDVEKAKQLLNKAAEKGSKEAQEMLGTFDKDTAQVKST